jgi:uncharacterized protein with HEPN domain
LSRSDDLRIADILEAAEQLASLVADGRERFDTESIRQRAAERLLEIIGEASNAISDEFKGEHPDVAWRHVVNLRHLGAHRRPFYCRRVGFTDVNHSWPLWSVWYPADSLQQERRLVAVLRRMMVVAVAVVLAACWPAAAGADGVGYEMSCPADFTMLQPFTATWLPPLQPPGTAIGKVVLVDNSLSGEHTFMRPSGAIPAPADRLWAGQKVCTVTTHSLPTGEILISKVDGRGVGVFGYVYDDYPDPLMLLATIDGKAQRHVLANYPWTAQPRWSPRADDRGFLVLVADVPPGEHELCIRPESRGLLQEDLVTRVPMSVVACTRITVK